jgi:hypothetical protein
MNVCHRRVYLFCSTAYAADYFDTKYREMMVKLKNTDKIQEKIKTTYLLSLEKAYQLCKQDKMEEARKIMDELRDQFLCDALINQQQFYGN